VTATLNFQSLLFILINLFFFAGPVPDHDPDPRRLSVLATASTGMLVTTTFGTGNPGCPFVPWQDERRDR